MKKSKEIIYDRSALTVGAGRTEKVAAQKTAPRGVMLSMGEPKLTIRIFGKCNFKCPACSTFSSPERPGRLGLRDFKRAVDILKSARFRGVLNISGGEPFLHQDLEKMLSYASRNLKNAKFVLFTNGFWVNLPHWKTRLGKLLKIKNALIRFSIDLQHIDGAIIATKGKITEKARKLTKAIYLNKALAFKQECERLGSKPGRNFDFAYKGTIDEGRRFLSAIADAPVYPILLQKDPRKRSKEFGYMAIDIDERGRPLVYLTLGHLAEGAPLGRLDRLGEAIAVNRRALKSKER